MRAGSDLHFQSGRLTNPGAREACDRLLRDVLGTTQVGHGAAADPWQSFACFVPDGRCIANVDAAILPLLIDGERREAAAIRSVAVDPAWRGKGLFRALMTQALAWCDARSSGLTLLYAGDQALYRGFGFKGVPQHAFAGAAPRPRPGRPARQLLPDNKEDARLLHTLIARRAPVSMQCALLIDERQFAANIAADDDLRIAYDSKRDAAIVYETDGDRLTIVDVVAATLPDMPAIIGALGVTPKRIRTLFPPDQLQWPGKPVTEDTGLMARGEMPAALTRHFMFPPTSEF